MANTKRANRPSNGASANYQTDSPTSRPALIKPVGGSDILGNFTGRVQADFLHELNGSQGYERYNEMRLNSPEIGAMLVAITQALINIDWYYTTDDEDAADDPRIEFLENARRGVHNGWKNHIREALTALVFGFAPFGIQYKRDGGQLVWDRFLLLGQDSIMRWHYDEGTQTLAAVSQWPHVYAPQIPMGRVINYRVNVEQDNPEGRSILRTAWIPYYYAKNLMSIEAIGYERNFSGFPTIKLPATADTTESTSESTDYGRATAVVRNIRADEQAGLVLPFGWEFEFTTAGANALANTIDGTIKRYQSRMMMSALSQFLLLGQDKVGALSLSQDQTDFFNMSVNSFADIMAETHTQEAMQRLLKLNGFDTEGIRLDHSPAGDVNVTLITEALTKAAQAGLVDWSPEDEVFFRSMANMPDRTVEQITEAREGAQAERAERQAQAMARLTPAPSIEPEADDEMGATLYASQAAAKRQRQRNEDEYTDTMEGFWDGQRKRIMRGARQLLNVSQFEAAPVKAEAPAPQPTVNITMAAQAPPVVTVNQPAQAPPQVTNTFNWPEQPAPHVDVHAADMPPPSVTVNVPEQAAPVVTVEAPVVNVEAPQVTNEIKLPGKVTEQTQVQRDSSGNITGAVSESRFED